MNGAALLALLRSYIDEPDQTFVTDANAQSYIQQGYREFRNRVMSCNPSTYTASVTLALSNVDSYDLALAANPVRILGASTLTNPRLMMLLNVRKVEAGSGDELRVLKGVPSRQALQTNPDGYFLDGSVLRFPEKQTGSYSVSYVPVTPTITFGAADAEFDDMTDWHDLIVLYAAKSYLIRDGGENPMLMSQMTIREGDLMRYIAERDVEAPMYVNEVYHTLDEGW